MPLPLPKPVRRILDQCPIGFTARKKLKITLCVLLYLAMPIDCIPDFLVPVGVADDLLALLLMVRVLLSPTLPVCRADTDVVDPSSLRRIEPIAPLREVVFAPLDEETPR